ncbi:MAG: hypothetical protein WD826_11705 [Actinomycetota bacterium]
MSELAFVIYLIAHGLMHGIVFLFPSGPDSPFDPHRSWIFEVIGVSDFAMGVIAMSLAATAVVFYLGTAVNYFASGVIKTRSTVLASIVSLGLIVLFFTPWLIVGALVDVGLIYAVTRNDPVLLTP